MRSRKRLKWIGAVALVALAVLFIAYFPGRPPSFPVPTPNGYNDFVRAAALNQKALENADVRQSYNKLPDATPEALRTWMWEGADAVAAFQKGLTNSCRVPVQATKTFGEEHSRTVAGLKAFTQFLVARAQLAALEGRTNDALMADLQAYDFARRIGNGGLMIDFLVSRACEAIVLKHLESLIPALNQRECTDAWTVLERADFEETPAIVVARTLRWERAVDPTGLAKARTAFWLKTIVEVCKTRSLAPLDALPTRRLEKREQSIKGTVEGIRQKLKEQRDKRLYDG